VFFCVLLRIYTTNTYVSYVMDTCMRMYYDAYISMVKSEVGRLVLGVEVK